ncbi:MAG: hypothetical protein PHE87_10505 [Victivallaceae bacterium]|nr:hypothetical protein [Victivallaceae bacterium]
MMMKKNIIFERRSGIMSFSLIILLFSSAYALGDAEKGDTGGQGFGISGTVRFKDAEPAVTHSGTEETRKRYGQQDDQGREALIGERNLLHKKLIETLERYQKQNEDYRRLRLSIAATLASREKHQTSKREEQLLVSLAKLSEDSRQLALKAVEFCDYAQALTSKLLVGQLQSAELALKIDELRDSARRTWYLANPKSEDQAVTRCRLLAVDDDLQIVVLPAGLAQGIFCGLNFYAGAKTRLTVISVRPNVAAAVVSEGSIKELAPGMEVSTSIENSK